MVSYILTRKPATWPNPSVERHVLDADPIEHLEEEHALRPVLLAVKGRQRMLHPFPSLCSLYPALVVIALLVALPEMLLGFLSVCNLSDHSTPIYKESVWHLWESSLKYKCLVPLFSPDLWLSPFLFNLRQRLH